MNLHRAGSALALMIGLSVLAAQASEVVIEEYKEIYADTVTYMDDILTITWGDEYEILSATVVTGFWNNAAPIQSGVPTPYAINVATGGKDEDVVIYGTAKTVATGEVFNFFTYVWAAECRWTIPPTPANGCNLFETHGSCSLTETATCNDGGSVSVTCKGVGGTCSGDSRDGTGEPGSGENDGSATCQAATTKTTTGPGNETTTETMTTKKTKTCS